MGALRLLLAVSVVLFHAHGLFGVELAGGVAAVETFFMISGFVMALVLAAKYDPVADRRLFYTNRALRIYVPYAVVLAYAAAVAAFAWRHAGSGPFAVMQAAAPTPASWLVIGLTHLAIVGQDLFLFFNLDQGALRWSGEPPGLGQVLLQLVPPAWSISLELVFYALAPWFARRSSRTLCLFVFGSLALRLALWRAGLPFDPWSYRFFPCALGFFLAGMLAYRLHAAGPAPRAVQRLAAAAVLLGLVALQPASLFCARLGLPEAAARWVFYGVVLTALPGLFAWTSRSRLDRFLGDFSYAVYLAHWPTLALIDALRPGLAPNARASLALIASLALAYLIAQLVEKPLDRLRQRRVATHARAAAGHSARAPVTVLETP